MAKGNEIIVSANPKGRFLEGVVTGTPKPGTVMEIDWSEAKSNGRFTWEPYGTTAADGIRGVGADGDRRIIAVLLPDSLQGKAATAAYVTGDRCFLYVPQAGEELNMLVEDVAGTGDDLRVGDIMIVDDGTGKLLETTGDPESEPFIVLEAVTNPTADTLVHCLYTGQ